MAVYLIHGTHPHEWENGRYYIKDGWLIVIDGSDEAWVFNIDSVVKFTVEKRDDE